MKFRPVGGAELFHGEEQKDRQDMTKLTVAFRNFVHALKNSTKTTGWNLQDTAGIFQESLHEFIYRLSEKFFRLCTTHYNPLVRQIGDYTIADLQLQYKKYIHKRTKHLLL